MKKIVYVGYAIPETEVLKASGVSVAGNKMQLNILHELCTYEDMRIYPITVYPCAAYPADSRFFYGRECLDLWNDCSVVRVGFINLPVIKQLCQMWHVFLEIRKYLKKNPNAEMLAFNMFPQVGNPLYWLGKVYDIKTTAIIADLPIDFNEKRGWISRILMSLFNVQTKRNIKAIDRGIVLNPYTVKKYMDKQEYIVVEGGIDRSVPFEELKMCRKKYEERERVIVYSGALEEYNGICNLLNSMTLIRENVTLRLYGDGSLRSLVESKAKEVPNIQYMGKVSNDEMMKIQRDAYLLINPRLINEPISQVTFPSKIFEYLASGTVVLTTRLNGFTDEYLDKMLFMKDDVKSIADKIDESMKISYEQMEQMAMQAYQFVTTEKNWKKQGKKIHDFLMADCENKMV